MSGPRPIAYVAMLVASVMWGATFSLQKIVMASEAAHPFGVTFLQAVLASMVGFGLAATRGHLPCFDRAHLRFYFLLGLVGTAVPNTIFYTVAPHLPAGVLALSVATVPLLTYIAAMALRIEHFERMRALGLLFGFAAVLLVLLPESSLPERGQALWLLPALLSAVCYAGEAMLATFARPEQTHSLVLIAGGMMMAALMMAPIVFFTETFYRVDWPLQRAELAFLTMSVVSMLAYAMYLYLVSAAGAVFASQVGYLVTLIAVGWGMLLFDERHSLWVWAAIVLLLIGMALVRPRKRVAKT